MDKTEKNQVEGLMFALIVEEFVLDNITGTMPLCLKCNNTILHKLS